METTYYTCENCSVALQNPTLEVLDEWLKDHKGHKIVTEKKVQTQFYDLGYNDLKKADELALVALSLGAVVADIRFQPHTRNPEFSQTHLQEVLGENYIHVGALGNQNYKGEGETRLVNADEGMKIINDLLKTKSVIIMCACWDRKNCHRLDVAHEYEKRFSILTSPITRSDARTLISAMKSASSPQMPLFPMEEK